MVRFRIPLCCNALRAALIVGACLGLMPANATAAEPPITAIAFAPDGESVVVASQAGLSVHDWPDLNRVRNLTTTLVNIHDMAFSPNGDSLAVAGGTPSETGMLQILAWPDGVSSCELHGHSDSVLAVVWKDSSSVATTSLDHEIVVWDVAEQRPVERLNGHSRGVSDLCFLSGHDVWVSSGLDQNLRVWNSESGTVIRTLNNHKNEIHEISLRPAVSGLPMVASVSNDRTVRLWQPTIGRMVRFAQLNATPLAVTWLTDGSLIAVATTDGDVRLIDPDTVEVLATIPAISGWAYSIAVHPSDGSLLVGGRNGQLKRIIPDASKR
jgi:WD40 repeat protein